MNVKDYIALRAAKLLKPGWVINVGVGIPTLVPKFVDLDSVYLHTENGLLGVGKPPKNGEVDPNLVNAAKEPITEVKGASYFDSASSFSMIRGGHIDAVVLGALQIDEKGKIANWIIPNQPVLGVGGAMDLAYGAKLVIIATTHTSKEGYPKIVKNTTFPITSLRPADWIVTELASFKVEHERLFLVEIAPGVDLETIKHKTEADFEVKI